MWLLENLDFGYSISQHPQNMRVKLIPDSAKDAPLAVVVRNPWDRVVSMYQWLSQTRSNNSMNLISHWNGQKIAWPSFKDFVMNYESDISIQALMFPRTTWFDFNTPQVTWLDGKTPDILLRYETLDGDMVTKIKQGVFDTGDITALPVVANSSRDRDYHPYYDSDTRAKVAAWFAADIAAFNYSF
jgi:hypothetical protein